MLVRAMRTTKVAAERKLSKGNIEPSRSSWSMVEGERYCDVTYRLPALPDSSLPPPPHLSLLLATVSSTLSAMLPAGADFSAMKSSQREDQPVHWHRHLCSSSTSLIQNIPQHFLGVFIRLSASKVSFGKIFSF